MLATWYCNNTHPWVVLSPCFYSHPDVGGLQMYAAAGPALRVAMSGTVSSAGPDPWRGRRVKVTSKSGLSVWVTLIDWCACGSGSSIDLYYDAFWALDKTGTVNPVTISW